MFFSVPGNRGGCAIINIVKKSVICNRLQVFATFLQYIKWTIFAVCGIIKIAKSYVFLLKMYIAFFRKKVYNFSTLCDKSGIICYLLWIKNTTVNVDDFTENIALLLKVKK